MKSVNDPGIIALKFKQVHPRAVRFQGQVFFVRFKIDEATPPGEIGERTPLGGDERGVIAVLTWADDAGVLIEGEGNIRFVGKARALENKFGTEFRYWCPPVFL